MKEISLKDLLEAGCHFGHQITRWNPKMRSFIYTTRDNIHIFDLAKTKAGLEAACAFAKATASQGGKIIFIGTKRQSQDIIKAAAQKVNMPYMTLRWIGGLLTNWEHVSKRIEHLRELKAGMLDGSFKDRTKKERLMISREIIKLERDFGGIADLTKLPEAVFVADAKKDEGAVKEAHLRGIKVIAIVDTNANPDLVDCLIPANDDATKSIQLIVDCLVEAIEEGAKAKSEAKEVGSEKLDKEVGNEKKVEEKKEEKKIVEKPKVKRVKKVSKVEKKANVIPSEAEGSLS